MMAFELKSEILAQISKTQDENMRIVLLLLLGVLEAGAEGMRQIADSGAEGVQRIAAKIDELRNDEDALRKAVLNGIAATHEDDHHWVAQHRKDVADYDAMMIRAEPLIKWVEQRVKDEQTAKDNRKSLVQRALEAAAAQMGTILITALATYTGLHFLGA